jgi:RHS repeat-associated protein
LRGANAYNYAINDAGRIKWVTGAGTASYLYDGFQKLRYRAQGGNVTNYLWDAFGHIIAEHNGTGGAALREYVWLGDTPLAVNEGVNLSYVHGDHLDRPVAMTTSGGPAIAWAAKYDPFGNVVSITSPTAMPLRFPGQYFQIEDGLSYNWHRNYDPALGRYSQADPLGFVDGPGVYNYAGASPVMRVDPQGLHSPELPELQWPYPPYYSPLWWGYQMCMIIAKTGRGGGDDPCTDRYEQEVKACNRNKWSTPHPDYIRACIARAKARQAACLRNGGPDGSNEPKEWDHNPDTGDSETGKNFGR